MEGSAQKRKTLAIDTYQVCASAQSATMSVRSRPRQPLVELRYPIPYRKGAHIKIAVLAAILVITSATVERTQVNVLQARLAALSIVQVL